MSVEARNVAWKTVPGESFVNRLATSGHGYCAPCRVQVGTTLSCSEFLPMHSVTPEFEKLLSEVKRRRDCAQGVYA